MSHVRPEELVELSCKHQFWLKPVCRLNITVQLPQLSSGKAAISTTAVVERINKRAKVQFKSLKVTKITIDFLRLEGELESLKQLDIVQQRLDRVKIKLDGFDEQLKLKTNKVKIGPFKHDWETFFRDNPHMDELKPGYRPDTVLIQNLPLKWFSKDDNLKTNWLIGTFSTFGDIRRFHIPLLDEIEKAKASKSDEMGGFKKFNFNSEHQTFDVYLMYKDYVGFVNAMDGLRGMKLVKCRKDEDFKTEYIEHDIRLEFDKSKHLSDKAIRRRQIAKKYGINTLDDLNEYKKKAKERKTLYEERMRQLKRHKKSSRNLLEFLARLVAVEEAKREQEELKALNERLLKERLLEEEKKLRNKLIERQRSLLLEKQLKEQAKAQDSNGFDSRDSPYDRPDADGPPDRSFNHRAPPDRYQQQQDFASARIVPRVHPHINPHINPHFNPKFEHHPHGNQTNHFNAFNGHPPHYQHRTAGGPAPNFRPPNNRNTFPYANQKSNYYDYQERSDYPKRADYAERSDYRGPDRGPDRRSDYQRPGFDRMSIDQPTGYRSNSFHERAAYPVDPVDYRERSGSYKGRGPQGDYQARESDRSNYRGNPGGYQERSDYRSDFRDRSDYRERSDYRDRSDYRERSDYRDRPEYRDRPPNEKPYDRPYNRSNSFGRPIYRADDEGDDRKSEEKSSRPKSLVVLPQK